MSSATTAAPAFHNPSATASTSATAAANTTDSTNSPSSFSTVLYPSQNSTDTAMSFTASNGVNKKLPSIPDDCAFEMDVVLEESEKNTRSNAYVVKTNVHDGGNEGMGGGGDKVNDPMNNPKIKKKLEMLENRFMGPPLKELQEQQRVSYHNTDCNNSRDNNGFRHQINGNDRCIKNTSNSSSDGANSINRGGSSQHSFNFETVHPATPSSNSNTQQLQKLRTHGKQSPIVKELDRCATIHMEKVKENLASRNVAATRFPPLVHSQSHIDHSNTAHSHSNNSSRGMSISSNQTLITAHVTNNNNNNNDDNNSSLNNNQQHHHHKQAKANKTVGTASSKTTARRSISTSISPSAVSQTLMSMPCTPSKRKASQPNKLPKPSLSNRKHQDITKQASSSKRRKIDAGVDAPATIKSAAVSINKRSVITPSTEKQSTPLSSLTIASSSTSQQHHPPTPHCIPNTCTSSSSSLGATNHHHNQNQQPKLTSFFSAMKKSASSSMHKNNNNGSLSSSSSSSCPANRTIKPEPQSQSQFLSQQSPVDHYEKQIQQLNDEVSKLNASQQKLNDVINDKNEQLKAIHNNQTIVTTQLRSTLSQREAHIKKLMSRIESQGMRYQSVLEDFIMKDIKRVQLSKRKKILSDGIRLGKYVYNRVGMRVEAAWEDGDVVKELLRKKMALSKKRDIMENRLKDGMDKLQSKQDNSLSNNDQSLHDGNHVHPLEREEFEQSIRIHLLQLEQEEKELQKEEDSIRSEKSAHKRELRRVANEETSRFKNRPKLHDRYIPMYQLGKGGFSEVWRCYDLVELREVAVKIHQLDPRWSGAKAENFIKHVSREYEIHRIVRHPRVVSLYDVFEIDTDTFATVLECCDGTDLDTLLQDRKRLPEQHARSILLQILSGMKYLSTPSQDKSRQAIIHYDLKPGNILFDEFGDAKITDFGLSKIMDSRDPSDSMELTSQGAGTYWYLPPECFVTSKGVRITNRVDVWSIGVIFYQMLYGQRPFGEGQSQERVLTNNIMLNAREVRFPDIPTVSKGAKNFIRHCLTYEQALRPSIAELCDSHYITGKK